MLETTPSPALPAWIHKRDGRLVPFEPDKISRALFAVTESLGRPDAFLARELADGILHFFAAEADGTIPSTALVAETVVKIARELGQPALAQAFADADRQRTRGARPVAVSGSPPRPDVAFAIALDQAPAKVLGSCLNVYSLNAIFARDLIAAQADELITLTGLEAPLQLSAGLLAPGAGPDALADPQGLFLVEAIEHARRAVGHWLAIDGPEHGLARHDGASARHSAEFTRELQIGLRTTGLTAVVNLNIATPPPWADNLAEGPLFAGYRPSVPAERRSSLAWGLLEALVRPGPPAGRARVCWHLEASDFTPSAQPRLLRLARLAQESSLLAFTFDRPKKTIALAEGLDRRHAAVLLTVGLHLPRLAALPGSHAAPDVFLQKLGTLARLALSAAAQKRDFLRRHQRDAGLNVPGFLVDRARVVVTPVGLEAVTLIYTGAGPCSSRPAFDFARKVVQRLRDVLRADGPTYQLDACLDGPGGFTLESPAGDGGAAIHPGPSTPSVEQWPDTLPTVAGLTSWDVAASPRNQLRAAGAWHGLADGGTAAIVSAESLPSEEAADLLRHAWEHTDVVRLRFVRAAARSTQLTALWSQGE